MGVLRVRVLVDRREEASHTLRTQVECSLAVRRIRSVGQDRDVRHVVSRPALCCLVPPDDGLRARIWFAVSIARRSVVENAHVVRPGPCEVGIEAETSGIRLRVPAFGEVYPAAENPSVDPGPGRGRAVGLQVGYSLDQIANLKAGDLVKRVADLQPDGSTSSGAWIYAGVFGGGVNLSKRRDSQTDPGGLGLYPNFAWTWPNNMRILYNRASCDRHGK